MKLAVMIPVLLFSTFTLAQSKLPVIKATSRHVDIRDGDFFDKNAWNVSPKVKLDVFTADRTRKTKYVTFYTDVDSIKVKVKPGTKFNFIILLNGKDSAYTQIASAIAPKNKIDNIGAVNDTIPFSLTLYNAIKVKAIINNTDTLDVHFDVSSFDFRIVRDAVIKKTKLLSNQPDALSGKAKPDYNNLNKVFKIQMGTSVLNNPTVGTTGLTAHDMDGRFGWNLFEGKSVEINYDKNIIVISNERPKAMKGFVKSKIQFIRSFVCARGNVKIENKKYAGNFMFDNGSDQAMILDSTWVSRQHFPGGLKLLKTATLRDPRGVKYETRTVLYPSLQISGFKLTNIPALLLGSKNPVGFEVNYLGNDFLKRFNMILDFKNDDVYLKPNKLMSVKYRESS